jgi:hypothetical protein
MKELTIRYKNANYTIRFECSTYRGRFPMFIDGRRCLNEHTDYIVFFDDLSLKEQFGDPFEFSTTPNFIDSPIQLPKNSASWNLADCIIKAISES